MLQQPPSQTLPVTRPQVQDPCHEALLEHQTSHRIAANPLDRCCDDPTPDLTHHHQPLRPASDEQFHANWAETVVPPSLPRLLHSASPLPCSGTLVTRGGSEQQFLFIIESRPQRALHLSSSPFSSPFTASALCLVDVAGLRLRPFASCFRPLLVHGLFHASLFALGG